MTPATCKQLLANGILQAYAEGKEIQIDNGSTWATWKGYEFNSSPENYRIKPTPQFEVGDLVRTSNGKIGKVYDMTRDSLNIVVGYPNDTRRYIWKADLLTKVHEVRTPFTFEQAVKACAEHGMEIRCNGFQGKITEIDYNSIFVEDSQYLYFESDCLGTVFTSDNTPFCNISYEELTS